jgi:hypothetical protein
VERCACVLAISLVNCRRFLSFAAGEDGGGSGPNTIQIVTPKSSYGDTTQIVNPKSSYGDARPGGEALMTAALLRRRWSSMAGSADILAFYTEHGQYGALSNFYPSPFEFELPVALLFGATSNQVVATSGRKPKSALRLSSGFRSPVAVQWAEQAIMLCKAAAFRDFHSLFVRTIFLKIKLEVVAGFCGQPV